MIIFEGEELLLHYYEGEGETLLITFASADQTEKAYTDYFLKPIAQKYRLPCLGITAKVDNFYQHSDMYHIIPLCNEISQKYKKVIIIGLSMGAYAALKFSAELHANIVFAMGARYTLDVKIAPVCGIMQRTVDRLDPHSIAKTTIQPHEVSGRLYIVHDTYQGMPGYNAIDHRHVSQIIANLPNTVLVPVSFAHHLVVNSLKGSEEFKSILDVLATENDQNIIKQVANIRRHHINNIYSKILLLRRRYPLLIYKLLISQSFSKVKNNHILFDNYENSLFLIYHLCIKGYRKESRNLLRICFLKAYLQCSFYEADQINQNHIKNISSSLPILPYLVAFNHYILVYDQAQKKIIAVRDFMYPKHCLPIRLYVDESGGRLVCLWEDMAFELIYNKNEILLIPLKLDVKIESRIVVQAQENTVSLHTSDNQSCLQIDQEGNSQFCHNYPREWETFAVI